MAHSPNSLSDSEVYRGPSQAELGGLADWLSPDEFRQLHVASRSMPSASLLPVAEPSLKTSFESYSGPAEGELADLGAWIDRNESGPTDRDTTPTIWREEPSPELERSPGPPGAPSPGIAANPELDTLLAELDQIREALQKRPTR